MLTKKQIKIQKKWKKANVTISKELRDIIHGYIMSDGHVSLEGSLSIEHSKKQEKFVEWLYNQLQSLRTNTPIRKFTRLDKRTNTPTYSTGFTTRSLLQGFRAMWYTSSFDNEGKIKYRKCLPKNLHCFFNVAFVTLWFAGDGTKMLNQRGAKIEVTCFTPDERRQLQTLFKDKFDISTKINRAGKAKSGTEQWTLSILSGEYDKFRELITQMDLIPTLFSYKLHKKLR
jgi:hypothetical protein